MTESEAKATARHKQIAKDKRDSLESKKAKIGAEKAALDDMIDTRKSEIRKLPREDRASAKEDLKKDVETRKETIARMTAEYKSVKAEVKEDNRKAKEKAAAEKKKH